MSVVGVARGAEPDEAALGGAAPLAGNDSSLTTSSSSSSECVASARSQIIKEAGKSGA